MLSAKLSSEYTSSMARQFITRLRGHFDTRFLAPAPVPRTVKESLFPINGIDASLPLVNREALAEVLPHRGDMLLLDHIAWVDAAGEQALAVKKLRHDEFWVAGHFPDQPVMPGVLMVEAGAQLALYLCKQSLLESEAGTLLRIENARFRCGAVPGDTLLILCRLAERNRTVFCYDIQGQVDGRIAFDGRIVGWPRRARRGV
jgi:3-hydroxymyristoyl/3-hydroxydecanoyl-(acyl carrier protein) dehydratase